MHQLPISHLPITEEQDAQGDIAQVFDDLRRDMEVPFIPNLFKAAAGSPLALAGTWEVFRHVYLQTTLPMSLKAMILFAIASANRCQYCSAVHQVTCKTLGIDEETLDALGKDLNTLTPRRVQEIIKFAVKCARQPATLTEADYDQVRAQGISDEELMELIALSALGAYLDTLADSMKIEVDGVFRQALGG